MCARSMMRHILALLATITLPSTVLHAAQPVYYSYFDGTAGAFGSIQADLESRTLKDAKVLFRSEPLVRIERSHFTANGERAVLVNEDTNMPVIAVLDMTKDPVPEPVQIRLPDRPMATAVYGDLVLAAGNESTIHLLDAREGKLLQTLDMKSGMEPPAYRVTQFLFSKDGTRALAAIRQEHPGKNEGHRLLLLEIPTLKLLASMPFERNHSELHFDASSKDNGPGPNLLLAEEQSNTLIVGLLNYGAIALADLNAAFEGRFENLTIHSTSPNGEWGVSFPNRGWTFAIGGKSYAFIGNSSVEGGSLIVDLAERRILQHIATGPREITNVWVQPGRNRLVGIHSGLLFERAQDGVADRHVESQEVFTVDYSGLAEGMPAVVKRALFPRFIYQLCPADPANENFVLLSVRRPSDSRLLQCLYEIDTQKFLYEERSLGVLRNFLLRPGSQGPAVWKP
jgi:hypothetical protein